MLSSTSFFSINYNTMPLFPPSVRHIISSSKQTSLFHFNTKTTTGFQREQPAPCYVASFLYQKYLSNLDKVLLLVTSPASSIRLETGIAKTRATLFHSMGKN